MNIHEVYKQVSALREQLLSCEEFELNVKWSGRDSHTWYVENMDQDDFLYFPVEHYPEPLESVTATLYRIDITEGKITLCANIKHLPKGDWLTFKLHDVVLTEPTSKFAHLDEALKRLGVDP